MEKKQEQIPYLFDLTQDEEDSSDVDTASVDNCCTTTFDGLGTGNRNSRLQLKECAITLDSDASSDCVFVLSPPNDQKHNTGSNGNNNPWMKSWNNNEKNPSAEEKTKPIASHPNDDDDADSDDDLNLLLQRPAFASSSVVGTIGGEYTSSYPTTKTVAYSDTGTRTKSCAMAISSSALSIESSSSKFTVKERRQQIRESEKQRKAFEKENARIQQTHEKEQKKLERERLKWQREMEKQQKQEDRKRFQLEKQQRKEQEKLERQQYLLEDQQEQGKFAQQEICIHLEKSLAESVLGGLIQMTLSDTYLVSSPNTSSYSECLVDAASTDSSSEVSNQSRSYTHHVPPIVDGCVQWSRRDYILGGATASYDPTSDDGVEWLDIVAVVFYDPKVFLRLLTREIVGLSEEEGGSFEDDFPLLRAWVKQLRESHARARLGLGGSNSSYAAVVKPPRIVLILHKVQEEMSQQWVKTNGRKKRRKSFIPTNEEELHDAIIWMLIEERIECAFTSTDLETIEYLKGLTRALSEYPYAELMTELQCIKKLKSTHGMIETSESSKNSGGKSPYDRAKDSWLRMLQQIKGLTEGMALRVVRYYPTARSLMEKYEDPNLTVDQKRTLLATLLMDGKRNMVKLSDSVYRLMTSEDPLELIL